jgi:Mn-dependent DtxR family transcriptional regulator
MSSYIQIPNSIITKLTKRSKQEEALVYAIIRNEIKDKSLKASIPEKQIADIIKMSERTVNSYVSDLKKVELLNEPERKQGKSGYPYNSYQFEYLKKEYFYLLPQFLEDKNISPKLKGLLLFIKANCFKGTNYLTFNKKEELHKLLHVGRNQLLADLKELESKSYIRYIGNSLHIINENFLLFWDQDMDNVTYKIIYDFCLEHDRVPPTKKVDGRNKDKALSWIVGAYTDDYERLRNDLNERCKNLPENLSLEYFCQVLRNKKPTREEQAYTPLILH